MRVDPKLQEVLAASDKKLAEAAASLRHTARRMVGSPAICTGVAEQLEAIRGDIADLLRETAEALKIIAEAPKEDA